MLKPSTIYHRFTSDRAVLLLTSNNTMLSRGHPQAAALG